MSKINFVRKIKIAILESDKNKKNEGYEYFKKIQYHAWQLANKIVQGQYFLKILPEIIIYKYPDDYKEYKKIEIELSQLKNIPKKKQSDLDVNNIKACYNKLNKFKEKYKSELDEYIRNQSIQNFTYSLNAEEFRELMPSTIRTSLNHKVYQELNNQYKDFKRGIVKVLSYKKDLVVPFQKTAIFDFIETKLINKSEFTFKLFGYKFICLLGKDLNNTSYILKSIINNDNNFELCDSAFQFKNNELFLIANIKTEQTKIKLDKNIIASIDLGITRMATLVIRNITNPSKTNYIERKFYGDTNFIHMVTSAKKRIKNCSTYNLGKTGKGKNKAILSKIDKLNKFQNFRDSFNKKITHQIIQRCIANNVSTIMLEDLSGISENNKFLKDWPYFDLQTKIKNKANEYGINTIMVNAAYTSQTCPSCEIIDKENRKTQENFECIACGYKNNADVVGALNIINMNIKNITSNLVN